MSSVFLSIRPEWVQKIKSGEKTVEIRKTHPQIETPFKCYIYETQGTYEVYHKGAMTKYAQGSGKVIGEFICSEITPLFSICKDNWELLLGSGHDYHKAIVTKQACMTEDMLRAYANHRNCYAWHISDLKIYRKPVDISSFSLSRPPQSWRYVKDIGYKKAV